jgi:Fe-S cluster assembly iron-binding protein IscA
MSGFNLLFLQEGVMIEVTPSATEQIAEYFKGKEVSPIRIFLNEGG